MVTPHFTRSKRLNFGFTLMELLIVIGIVAVLAGLIMPVLKSVQESAARTKCLSQVRQLGVALIGYAGDHDNLGPYDGRDKGNLSISMWVENPGYQFYPLFPYISQNLNIHVTPPFLICPSMSDPYLKLVKNPNNRTCSYGLNPDVTSNPGHMMKLMNLPARRVAITDAWFNWGYPNVQYDNHRGTGINVFRLDGSAEWIVASRYAKCNSWDWSVFDKL